MSRKRLRWEGILIGSVISAALVTTIFLFVILGKSSWIIDSVTAFLGFLVLIVSALALLLYYLGNRIFKSLDDVVESNGANFKAAIQDLLDGFREPNSEKTGESLNTLVRRVVGWVLWREVRILSVAAVVGVLGAFLTMVGTSVLLQQNELIATQNSIDQDSKQPNYQLSSQLTVIDTICEHNFAVANVSTPSRAETMNGISFLLISVEFANGKKVLLEPLDGVFQNRTRNGRIMQFVANCIEEPTEILRNELAPSIMAKLNEGKLKTLKVEIDILPFVLIHYQDIFNNWNSAAFLGDNKSGFYQNSFAEYTQVGRALANELYEQFVHTFKNGNIVELGTLIGGDDHSDYVSKICRQLQKKRPQIEDRNLSEILYTEFGIEGN